MLCLHASVITIYSFNVRLLLVIESLFIEVIWILLPHLKAINSLLLIRILDTFLFSSFNVPN